MNDHMNPQEQYVTQAAFNQYVKFTNDRLADLAQQVQRLAEALKQTLVIQEGIVTRLTTGDK